LGLKRFSKENSTKLCFSSLSSFNGHEWMFGVSVSFGGSGHEWIHVLVLVCGKLTQN
jgi:hypothetical protein